MKCRLLTITDDYVGVPSPEGSLINEFKVIIDRDDSENKLMASKELAYIYYMVDWESPYASTAKESKSESIINSLFEQEWKPDDAVSAGIEKYKELYENDYIKMLKAARDGARKLRNYFETVNLNERDNNNKLVHRVSDLTRNLKEVGSIIEGLQDLEELVKKNQTKANQNRGDVEVNRFSA